MPVYALGVEYDGSAFHGYQSQPGVLTVQDALQASLSKVADTPLSVVAAGRTDSGVHATQQVVSFRFDGERPLSAWVRGVNSNLPNAACVLWAVRAPDDFHARFDATWRRYVYVFGERDPLPAIGRQLATWTPTPIDDRAMDEAARVLIGEHDFSTFRAAQCQSRSPVRRIHSISVRRRGHLIYIDVCANAFLLHMVRNIAGTLLAVGKGEMPTSRVGELLALRDRVPAPPTAASDGLYFVHVNYPNLPEPTRPRTPPILGPLVLD